MSLDIFLFRVFTKHGRFHVSVDAESWEQGEQLVRASFNRLGVKMERIVRAKYNTGPEEERIILSNHGQRRNAGRKLWRAMGMEEDFELVIKRLRGNT